MSDVWDSFYRGAEWGGREGGRIRDSRAFRAGGLEGVADAAGRNGDMEAMNTAQVMSQRNRRFEDEHTQRAYERMNTIAPWARNVVRATRSMEPDRVGAFLGRPDIRQRFLDFGFKEEEINAGIAGLSDADPAVRQQWQSELDAAFTQHQDPSWQVSQFTGQAQAVTPEGQFITGGASPDAAAIQERAGLETQTARRAANAPYPNSGGFGGGQRRRILTPEEVEAEGLNPDVTWERDVVSGATISRGGGGALAGAEQRGRIALSLPNVIQAQEDLARMEEEAARHPGARGASTPYGQDWGARVLEAVPFDGGAAARIAGGSDYQAYETAARSFEQSILPAFAGNAVTESEAQRFVRANQPRLGDTPETLRQKRRSRARIINSAATIMREAPPYPDAGFWSPSAGLVGITPTQQGSGAPGPTSASTDDLDAREQELLRLREQLTRGQ